MKQYFRSPNTMLMMSLIRFIFKNNMLLSSINLRFKYQTREIGG